MCYSINMLFNVNKYKKYVIAKICYAMQMCNAMWTCYSKNMLCNVNNYKKMCYSINMLFNVNKYK